MIMAGRQDQKRDPDGRYAYDPSKHGLPAAGKPDMPYGDDTDDATQPQTVRELTTPQFDGGTAYEGNICSDTFETRNREWQWRKTMINAAIHTHSADQLDYLAEQMYLDAYAQAQDDLDDPDQPADDDSVIAKLDGMDPWINPNIGEEFAEEMRIIRDEQVSQLEHVELDTPIVAFDSMHDRDEQHRNADIRDYANIAELMNDDRWYRNIDSSSWSVDARGELIMSRHPGVTRPNIIAFRKLKPGLDPDDLDECSDKDLLQQCTLPVGRDITDHFNAPAPAPQPAGRQQYDNMWAAQQYEDMWAAWERNNPADDDEY